MRHTSKSSIKGQISILKELVMAERNDCPSSDLNPLTCNGELDEELDNNATSENEVTILAVKECKFEKNVEIIGVHDLATCQLCFLCK